MSLLTDQWPTKGSFKANNGLSFSLTSGLRELEPVSVSTLHSTATFSTDLDWTSIWAEQWATLGIYVRLLKWKDTVGRKVYAGTIEKIERDGEKQEGEIHIQFVFSSLTQVFKPVDWLGVVQNLKVHQRRVRGHLALYKNLAAFFNDATFVAVRNAEHNVRFVCQRRKKQSVAIWNILIKVSPNMDLTWKLPTPTSQGWLFSFERKREKVGNSTVDSSGEEKVEVSRTATDCQWKGQGRQGCTMPMYKLPVPIGSVHTCHIAHHPITGLFARLCARQVPLCTVVISVSIY